MLSLDLQHLLVEPNDILFLGLQLDLYALDHLLEHLYLDILVVDLVLGLCDNLLSLDLEYLDVLTLLLDLVKELCVLKLEGRVDLGLELGYSMIAISDSVVEALNH